MAIKKRSPNYNQDYETLVKIKLAAEVLKAGFWMGDLVDFLGGHNIKVIGNQTNTSKFIIAKSSLVAVKDANKLEKIFNALINNKYWYYQKPVKALEGLQKAISIKKLMNKSDKKIGNISIREIHPVIRKVSEKLYSNGHFPQAILEAYKAVVNQVKLVSGLSLDGKPLMDKAFSLQNPKIKLNNLVSQSDKDEQLGFMLLYSGAVLGIRNPKAHDLIVQKDPFKTMEYLCFASLLLRKLDERIVAKPKG